MLDHPPADMPSNGHEGMLARLDSANVVMQVCRRSWNRICWRARLRAARHAGRHDLIGRDGSIQDRLRIRGR
jgi:hypothetical protein